MRNWKTSLAAVAGVLAVLTKLLNGGTLDTDDYAIIATLAGLLAAKDHNVSGT